MLYTKKEKKRIVRITKKQEFKITTGFEDDKKFIRSLIYHCFFFKDITLDEMIEMINARYKVIHSIFTYEDLTKGIGVVKYD